MMNKCDECSMVIRHPAGNWTSLTVVILNVQIWIQHKTQLRTWCWGLVILKLLAILKESVSTQSMGCPWQMIPSSTHVSRPEHILKRNVLNLTFWNAKISFIHLILLQMWVQQRQLGLAVEWIFNLQSSCGQTTSPNKCWYSSDV